MVTRQIGFARIDQGRDDAGEVIPFELNAALREIDDLRFDETGRISPTHKDGESLTMWIDSLGRNATFKIAKLRTRGLPPQAEGERLSDLNIPENAGLAELTHMVYFSRTGIIGVELNSNGPPVTMLRSYFREVIPHTHRRLWVSILMNQDMASRLNRLEYLTRLRLKVREPQLETIRRYDRSLSQLFHDNMEQIGSSFLDITVGTRPRSKNPLPNGIFETLKALARRHQLPLAIETGEVWGYQDDESRQQHINLVRDKLITSREVRLVEDEHSIHVDSTSAYGAIRNAYNELEESLIEAISVA